MKPRILYCGEYHKLNTGYAVYGRELLKRLYATGEFEVAELASYVEPEDLSNSPWKVYPVIPKKGTELRKQYNPSSPDQFGAGMFDRVCIDFKPTCVLDIRDFWMFEHQHSSPARPYFNWAIMPTVDSTPQHEQWLSVYSDADAVFTYQDWSLNILNHEGGGLIKTVCSAPPAADEIFYPISIEDRADLKKHVGLGDKLVIGTVMRNQRRKLFPDLFKALSILIKEYGRDDVVLYCHTSYPDMGWDLPKYLNEHGVMNKVYFTYVCQNKECRNVFPALFNDSLTICPKCNMNTAAVASTQNGVSNEQLCQIYNMFDLYVQYSNSEGFGMPQVEAAACGVPVCGINFSAMEDILEKLGGMKIRPLCLSDELETGCKRAIACNTIAADTFYDFLSKSEDERNTKRFQTRMKFEEHYASWDKTASSWINKIREFNHEEKAKMWSRPAKYHVPSTKIPERCSNAEYSKFLIADVLGQPELLNTHMEARLIRDLNYGCSIVGMGGMYFNEMGAAFSKPNYTEFNRKLAYEHMEALCNRRNSWEKARYESIVRSSLPRG